ncbi:hypothetical protein H5410_017617 [Solanum commersonii]|uniref:Uncharacterized protein n=1 Tax=Solanum commersonii TaxID=4109 RepID=A0A9J5ZZT4_SOLCO|nr:hypothetical protein H5410_017617 [Solanum commersonii]
MVTEQQAAPNRNGEPPKSAATTLTNNLATTTRLLLFLSFPFLFLSAKATPASKESNNSSRREFRSAAIAPLDRACLEEKFLALGKFNASWTLSGDVRHLLETKNMRWWGRGSLGPTDMMTPTQS